ncbi:MAG: hypothetical protein F4W95_10345 [Chloroflexi bacterium]|nr:hypothetical protein [Chloroflexota bacterium]MYD48872.1 hypothetical protein [Chloroflexota bacterium]
MTPSQGEMRELYPQPGEAYRYRMEEREGCFYFDLEGDAPEGSESAITLEIESRGAGEGLCRTESGRTVSFSWVWVGSELHLWLDGALFVFQREAPVAGAGRRRGRAAAGDAPGDVLAPMPGAVLEVLVVEGDRVESNQTVMIMESMKMELVITASRSGVVRRVAVQPGQQVERGMRLLELAPDLQPTNPTGNGED